MNHTPGPWKQHGCTVYQNDNWKDGTNLGGRLVARCYAHTVPDTDPEDTIAEDAANARLIAAAPELLAALREIMAHEARYVGSLSYSTAKAAIAKAQG